MIKFVIDYFEAPDIGDELKKIIKNINNPEDYVLSLQLDYRDHNTLFFLEKITEIDFQRNMLKIVQNNESYAFFNYENILEYCILKDSEVIKLDAGG